MRLLAEVTLSGRTGLRLGGESFPGPPSLISESHQCSSDGANLLIIHCHSHPRDKHRNPWVEGHRVRNYPDVLSNAFCPGGRSFPNPFTTPQSKTTANCIFYFIFAFSMFTMPSLKIAVVGTGLIGPRHAKAVLQDCEARLSCIVDPNPAAKNVAENLGTVWYASIQDMLVSSTVPDAAIVCTPNHTHVAVAKELLDGGIHVLVEKPISHDIVSGLDLVRTISLRYNIHNQPNSCE
jgi:hypothetical protein